MDWRLGGHWYHVSHEGFDVQNNCVRIHQNQLCLFSVIVDFDHVFNLLKLEDDLSEEVTNADKHRVSQFPYRELLFVEGA